MVLNSKQKFSKTSMGLSAIVIASISFGFNPLNILGGCASPSTDTSTTETTTTTAEGTGTLEFTQDPLTYDYAALEPHIDARTMEIHYTKHHTAYINNANAALGEENNPYDTAEDLFSNISSYSSKLRNNAGGAWNHSFFWKSMRAPAADNAPTGALANAINDSFGSFEAFKEEFASAATGQFGSGWAWLVSDGGTLKIGSTPNQDNPLMDDVDLDGRPLLGLDVWEHAYYLHYQNLRGDYVTAWWNVVDWDFVSSQYESL